MKNRLQFDRIPALFASGITYLSGTTMGVSGREKATEALEAYIKRRDFIPLIGEPIVVRYIDDKGKKQAMLAIGKATGSTENDTRGIEYHIIDSAKLQEDIDLANANAAEALDLASAATHDIANHLVILKNMIGPNGIFMEDASFFDGESDDPSNVGLYKNWSGNPTPYPTTYISGATNMFEADLMLDAAIKEQDIKIEVLSGITKETIDSLNELWEKASELSAVTAEFSASTVNELNEIESDLEELSAATKSFSAASTTLFDTIIEAAGLNDDERGSYPGHDETHIIKDATSLDNADVLLDAAIWAVSGTAGELSGDLEELSAATVTIEENLAETNEKLEELSAATVTVEEKENNIIEAEGLKEDGTYDHERAHDSKYFKDAFTAFDADEMLDDAISDLSANTMAADQALDDKIDELSANTMDADQALQDQIDELGNRRVLGVSAITVETLENGNSKVSLLINEEDDKVLTQNALGLKANLSLVYIRDDKKIYLKGKNDIIISEIDANDFIKDGMLSAASVFTATEEDHEQYPELIVGKTYIKLLFNTDAEEPGRANPIFISAEDLVDIYTVAPESYTYMEISDYVIKLNVDAENGLASYNYARNISAVTTNIISATGLNMGEQGGYPGHDETHYIKNAVNLDNADVLLDEAIWNTNQGLTELSATTKDFSGATHTILENIIAGAGLNDGEQGGYPGHDETHIIKSATSLDNADVLLDDAIWTVSGMVNGFDERIAELEEEMDELSAVTGDFSAATYQEFIEINERIDDIEEVTAGALNNLDERLTQVEEEIKENSGLTILSAAVISFSSATVNEFDNVNTDITNLSSFTQYLSAHSLGMLTVNLNGVQQGTYCPSASTTLNLTAITEVTGADVLLTGYEISSSSTEVKETDNVNEAFGKVQKQIYDNEEIIAGVLNELDERVIANRDDIKNLSGVVLQDEYVIAQSLNDLNNRIIELSGGSFNGADYDSTTKKINFYCGDIIIDSIDATDFIKDGMLNNVEVVVISGETHLIFTFNTDAGKEAIDIPLSDFAALYTAGSGITITDNNEIRLKLANKGDTNFIKLDGDGLYLTGVTELSQDITNLSAITYSFGQDIASLSASVASLSASWIDDEYVIAQSLNDLNRRIKELSGNTGSGGIGGAASELDHDVTFNIKGESYGSARTSFDGSQVNIETYKKFTTGTSTTNLELNEFLTILEVSASSTLTVQSSGLPTLPSGGVKESHVIIENTSNSAIVITIDNSDTRLKFTNGNTIAIEPNGIGELNALITYNGSEYTIYMITS